VRPSNLPGNELRTALIAAASTAGTLGRAALIDGPRVIATSQCPMDQADLSRSDNAPIGNGEWF
jgi:hypothetical protein